MIRLVGFGFDRMVVSKFLAADPDNDTVLSFLQFEDKSDAVFDITEKCKYFCLFLQGHITNYFSEVSLLPEKTIWPFS